MSLVIRCHQSMTINKLNTMENKIIRIISQTLGVAQEEINPSDKLVDLAPDSIKLFELLIALEQSFEHKADYQDVANIETVGQVFAYVRALEK